MSSWKNLKFKSCRICYNKLGFGHAGQYLSDFSYSQQLVTNKPLFLGSLSYGEVKYSSEIIPWRSHWTFKIITLIFVDVSDAFKWMNRLIYTKTSWKFTSAKPFSLQLLPSIPSHFTRTLNTPYKCVFNILLDFLRVSWCRILGKDVFLVPEPMRICSLSNVS